MPVMDEFKEEREALKNGTFKEKLMYFIYYYKWHVLAVIIIAAIVISLLHAFLSRKDIAFYGVFLNAVETGANPDYSSDFGNAMGIDLEEYDVYFDSTVFIDMTKMDEATVASSQKIMVYLAAGDLDMIVTDTGSLEHYAYLDTLTDLRTLLSPEQTEKYEPYFYYVDKKIVTERAAAVDSMDMEYVPVYPENPFDPSSMAEPVPVGICMDSCEVLRENYRFKEGNLVFGVFVTSKHTDLALEYLEYTFPDE
ncbi:MAG: hypothetical protein NC081_09000 [Roseburia sp.]|nr:hypothetical protein [Roseburia sp.]